MEKALNYLFIGRKSINLLNNKLETISGVENSVLNPDNLKNPVPSFDSFVNLLTSFKDRGFYNTVILSDTFFFSQVIDIENFPLSYSKREEVLRWKLSNLLPFGIESYIIKYFIAGKNRVLFYALPVPLYTQLNKGLKELNLKCWNIVPESMFAFNMVPSIDTHTLFLLNRGWYFTAILYNKKELIYLKTRKRVKGIDMKSEIELIKNTVQDRFSIEIERFLVSGKEDLEGFEKIMRGFGFED